MRKKILRIMAGAIAVAVVLSVVSVLGACKDTKAKETVIQHINKLNEEKELKFVVDSDDSVHTAVEKYDDNGTLVYMYNEITDKATNEINTKRLYQNGKDYDLISKTYYEIVMTSNPSIGGGVPDIVLLELETTTCKKIGKNKYLATIYPRTILGETYAHSVFEYIITIKDDFVTEAFFAGKTTTISRDVGKSITIVESEFSNRY